MAFKLYVGNLSYQASEEELSGLFGQAGTVLSVTIVKDRYSGRSRGFGFVEMASREEADKAKTQFNGYSLQERSLVVDDARPTREKRPYR